MTMQRVALGLSMFCLVALAVRGQSQADIVAKSKLAQLQAEAEAEAKVAAAIKAANALKNNFSDKAARDLKTAQINLNDNLGLSKAKREALAEQLETAIAKLGGARTKPKTGEFDPKVLERIKKAQKQHDAADAENKDVNDTIGDIAADFEAKRDRDAKAKIVALARKYPDNPSVLLLAGREPNREAILSSQRIARDSAEGFRVAMNSVQESAIPIVGDISFPKDWKEKMEFRRKLNAPKLTEIERKLIEAMKAPYKTELKNAPFEEAIQAFSTTIDQKIYLDKKSLEDTGIDLKSTVNVPGNLTAKSALRIMLQQQGLTYIIRDDIIQVVSLEEARKVLVTRAYDVRDLVAGGGPFNTLTQWGPYADAQQTYVNAAMLVDAIQKSVDPKSWKDTGNGVGTVVFNYATMSIIVRAPSDVQAELYDKMYPPVK